MKTIEGRSAIPYPTPYMQGLFPSLCAELAHIEALIKVAPNVIDTEHLVRLATLEELLVAYYEVLALFLAHPTRRLSQLLCTAVDQAEAAIGWLIEHPPAPPNDTPSDFSYPAICEHIRVGVADWRLAVDLSSAYHDLDTALAETLH